MVWTCPEENSEDVGGRMLRMELPGRRPEGRAQSRSMEL